MSEQSRDQVQFSFLDRHLDAFWMVAEKGSLLGAAKALYISQPALTKQINRLEEQVGFRLFKRSNKGAVLTQAGERFLLETHRLQEEYETLVRDCRQIAANERGKLRVGYFVNVRSSYSLVVAEAYHKRYPEEEMELLEISTDGCLRDLLRERVDVFAGYDSRGFDREDVVFCPLKSWDYYVNLPPGHVLCGKGELAAEDLAGQKLMMPPYGIFRGTDALLDLIRSLDPGTDIMTEIYDNTTYFRCAMQGRIAVYFGHPAEDPAYVTRHLIWEPKAAHGIIYRKNPAENVWRFVTLAKELDASGS